MTYRLTEASLRAAIKHLCRYGDTDVFPHLPELAFFAEQEEDIISELTKLDLDTYEPLGAVEALTPKSRYGFRVAHQLTALDTLLFLACVVEIGQDIEAKRQPVENTRAFSYRFAVDASEGQIFRPNHTFKDWLHQQLAIIRNDENIQSIVNTDISDFYPRINFHRLQNLLDEVAPGCGAGRFIMKHLRVIRAKQSFGLPMGGTASRLLAELALIDTDQALVNAGLIATRFVDDFRIFLRSSEHPYDAMGFLAEQVSINEGLSLSAPKTSVSSRAGFSAYLEKMTTDVADEAESDALEVLTAEVYFDQEPDQDALEKLKGLNLVEILDREIDAEHWDMGRIKVVFRALKIVRPPEAIDFIKANLERMTIFARDLCLLMEGLEAENPGCFDELLNQVIEIIRTPPAASVQLIRTWFVEMLVRGIINIPLQRTKELEVLPSIIDKRQLLLIRGRCGDRNFFRRQKTGLHTFSAFELPALVWGASCLPQDEYETWLSNSRPSFDRPLGQLFLRWAAKNRSTLVAKLKPSNLEHPD